MTRETAPERRARLARATVWSPADMAFLFGVTRQTVFRWIRRGMPATTGVDEHGQDIWVIDSNAARTWMETATRRRR